MKLAFPERGGIVYLRQLHKTIARHMRRSYRRPILDYLEMHLTDHCNLNCMGCGHFSPLAAPSFEDVDIFSRDVKRMSELFRNISVIRLMGGEPLLHPRVHEFLAITRSYFQRSDVRLVTNGILLERMSKTFWDACRDNHIKIDLARYPLPLDLQALQHISSDNRVKMQIDGVNHEFLAFMNLKGTSDPFKAIRYCRSICYTPFLQRGLIYVCAMPALAHYFNTKFRTNIPADGGIDIHDKRMTGRKIIGALEKPAAACRYCATEWRAFTWGISQKAIGEWLA